MENNGTLQTLEHVSALLAQGATAQAREELDSLIKTLKDGDGLFEKIIQSMEESQKKELAELQSKIKEDFFKEMKGRRRK